MGGVQANFFTSPHPLNPVYWDWHSPSTYIGIASGMLTGMGLVGIQLPTLIPQVPGIIPNGALHAGMNVAVNVLINYASGKPIFDDWQSAAISGFVNGAITGYQLANAKGLNVWWGSEIAPNRNKWSLAWWEKPEVAKFDVHNYGAAQLNCRAKCLQDMYGGTEEEWWKFSGKSDYDLDYIRAFRNQGADIMQYPVESDDYVNFDEILNLQKSGGKIIYSVQNYHGGSEGHAMVVRKVVYIPNKRFDLQIINPETGTIEWVRNFKNNYSYGTEPHLWFICW